MKTIILLAGFGTRMRPHTWSRPKPLIKVAGNTIVGHLLDHMRVLLNDDVIFVVGYKGDMIEAWIRDNYPELNAHFVVQEEALGQAHAVSLCRPFLQDDDEAIVAFGDGIVRGPFARFQEIAGVSADVVLTVQEVEDPRKFGVVALTPQGTVAQFIEKPPDDRFKLVAAGINWFRSSRHLLSAVDAVMASERQTLGEYFMADVYSEMLERGVTMRVMPVNYWYDAGNPENILDTNRHLLGLGVGTTSDAMEWGYGDGYTVVPPVFIHESAEIESSIIGPFAHIDAGAVIRNSVISNSIIDPGATVDTAILDQALVGENATVTGKGRALFIGDNGQITL
ncbi:MAG: sugar phosphate nucleotidyltransferase [Anaerolineae bacterium]|nr:sugar phosphate nucleotidyltransferase [Anaerolineae bacterium]MCO5193188.1 sugar phosphate nucleotidyltransferase [Anaerolineae bacterium]MCO5205439.1 sugar phosphate nucleotidyltransferase [Anaerolineae bacterium]